MYVLFGTASPEQLLILCQLHFTCDNSAFANRIFRSVCRWPGVIIIPPTCL